jgi:hypothetical protein
MTLHDDTTPIQPLNLLKRDQARSWAVLGVPTINRIQYTANQSKFLLLQKHPIEILASFLSK